MQLCAVNCSLNIISFFFLNECEYLKAIPQEKKFDPLEQILTFVYHLTVRSWVGNGWRICDILLHFLISAFETNAL